VFTHNADEYQSIFITVEKSGNDNAIALKVNLKIKYKRIRNATKTSQLPIIFKKFHPNLFNFSGEIHVIKID